MLLMSVPLNSMVKKSMLCLSAQTVLYLKANKETNSTTASWIPLLTTGIKL